VSSAAHLVTECDAERLTLPYTGLRPHLCEAFSYFKWQKIIPHGGRYILQFKRSELTKRKIGDNARAYPNPRRPNIIIISSLVGASLQLASNPRPSIAVTVPNKVARCVNKLRGLRRFPDVHCAVCCYIHVLFHPSVLLCDRLCTHLQLLHRQITTQQQGYDD
jgi:hypothetical protein